MLMGRFEFSHTRGDVPEMPHERCIRGGLCKTPGNEDWVQAPGEAATEREPRREPGWAAAVFRGALGAPAPPGGGHLTRG